MGAVLERLFGERPARSAVNDYMFPPSRPHVEYGTGRIVRPAAALAWRRRRSGRSRATASSETIGECGRFRSADQDAAIRRLFPAFRQTCPFDFMGMWRGPLRPLARTYEIGIAYFPRVHFAGAVIANPWITVEVLDPVIGLDPRGTGEMPPHIYRRPETTSGWSLCLYDPRTGGLGAATG